MEAVVPPGGGQETAMLGGQDSGKTPLLRADSGKTPAATSAKHFVAPAEVLTYVLVVLA